MDHKSNICLRASRPFIYAAFNLSHASQWWPNEWGSWNTTLTAISIKARAGRGNGLNHVWYLMPSLFLFANHIVLTIFCMISALRKPRRSSCTSTWCFPPTYQSLQWAHPTANQPTLNAKFAPSFSSSTNARFFLIANLVWLLWKLNIISTRGRSLVLSSLRTCEPRLVIYIT